nr:CHRD domain-containing protein [Patescibacteria group bacterium]
SLALADTQSSNYKHTLTASLSGDMEVPSVQTPGKGEAMLHVSGDEREIHYKLKVNNLSSTVTGAHLHCAPKGQNGPVIVALNNPTMGSTSSMYSEGMITEAQITEAAKTCSPNIHTMSHLVQAVREGMIYVNVHTPQHPNGEVRGQVMIHDMNMTGTTSMNMPMQNNMHYGSSTMTMGSTTEMHNQYMNEVDGLLMKAAENTGVSKDSFANNLVASRFNSSDNVFLPSALALNFQKKQVTLPLYKGIGPNGKSVYYILTEAADFEVAKKLGLNYAPKLVYGRGTEGSQNVTLENGMMKFKGDVDFSPVRQLAPGPFPNTFPPVMAQPGAVGDAEYSPLVVLPSGMVLNAMIVANDTGVHDHLVSMDKAKGTIVFELLDGFENGQQYYFHLVTESSDPGAATIERGTYAPRLGKLPEFGNSATGGKSALLAFSPIANGETGAYNPERQGLNSTILDGQTYDPINVFPLDPDNNKRESNNYSPMWDAHINMWTPEAIAAGHRRRIKSFADLEQLVAKGYVKDIPANMGTPNSFAAGLKPSNAIINCPVIAQPVNI